MTRLPTDENRSKKLDDRKPHPVKKAENPDRKSKLSEKYKYVRFVEKKKVIRKMRQLQRMLQTKPDESSEIETELSELRKDLMYVEKFPGNQKYISLFPSEGQLSEECLKKQKEIRAMIVNLTRKSEEGSRTQKYDAVQNDDFFASVDNVVKHPSMPPTEMNQMKTKAHVKPVTKDNKSVVHPSWEAKTQNDKLTGSIAQVKFEGNRVVFDDE